MDMGKLAGLAFKLPSVVEGIMAIVHKVKGAPKADKVAAVIAALPDSVALAEFAADKDLFNDANIQSLVAALAEAQHAVEDARVALRAGILAKKAA